MKYFLAIFAVVLIVGCLVAGKRGDTSRKPPIEVFPTWTAIKAAGHRRRTDFSPMD